MPTDGYDTGARLLHWAIALLVVVTVPIGITMYEIPGGHVQDVLYVVHESIGLSILALMLARLLWRLTHGAPAPSPALGPVEVRASRSVHWLLYALLIAMPLSGYVFVVAGGYPLTYFDLFQVPRLLAKHPSVSDMAEHGHLTLQWAIYLFVAMHVGAALHHRFVRRNDVLARMWR
ncbi:MAG TPA: cytochrome b [Stellaceae bacterium]|nr:cytochrome b [Stellaceae bacterium]